MGRIETVRVVVVSPFDPRPSAATVGGGHVGGVENALQSLAHALARLGVDVSVLATTEGNPSHDRVQDVEYLTVRRRTVAFRAPLSTLALQIPRDADVVHIPATYPTISDLGPWLLKRRGQPVVLDYHFEPVATSRAMAIAAAAYRATFARLARRADRIVVKSADYADSSRFLERVPKDRLRVVPNGVDAARFAVDAPRTNAVLCVGRLVPYKGVETLVAAMKLVQQEAEAPLLVAGDGPLRAALSARAKAEGVDARFLGFVPPEDLPVLYASARVTALASVNRQEAFGMVLLESMAAGTPVVASDLPGVRAVARLGGRVARAGDPRDFARAILETLKSETRGDVLRRRIASEFDWSVVARRMLSVYEEVVP